MTAFWIERRNPEPLSRANVFDERQVKGRRRQRIFLKPSTDGAKQRAVVEVDVRPVAKEFKVLISGAAHGFQKVYGHLVATVDLSRNSKVHWRIVQVAAPSGTLPVQRSRAL